MNLKDVVLLGRNWAEYSAYFGLDGLDLGKERILDMGAGVSSLCAEATERGYDVTAADPVYSLPADVIEAKCKADLEEVVHQLPEVAHKYNWVFYRDVEDLKHHREEAYRRFLVHYRDHRERYVAGSLPKTRFRDHAFSLTLVSHLLFLYEDRLDYDFHRQSILELARITSHEIRIYPLTNLKAERSPFVERLMQDPDCSGLVFDIRKIDFEFFKNSDELLVITKAESLQDGGTEVCR